MSESPKECKHCRSDKEPCRDDSTTATALPQPRKIQIGKQVSGKRTGDATMKPQQNINA
jgi:hypothetical protein